MIRDANESGRLISEATFSENRKMSGSRVLALLALLVGSAHCFSWDIVACVDERLEFYYNGTLTHSEELPVLLIHSITYDPVQDRVLFYHVRDYNKTVSSYDIATRKIQTLFTEVSNGNKGRIAYDPVTQVIFWKEGNFIYSFSINPETPEEEAYQKLLFIFDYYINDLAVDSCGGYIYWVSDRFVERSRFDGSERKRIVFGKVFNRQSLVIDQQTQKLYWTETTMPSGIGSYKLTIESADFDGNNSSTFHIKRNVIYAHTLAISKDFIYEQYHDVEGIWQIPKNSSQNVAPKLYSKTKSYRWGCHFVAANYKLQEQIQGVKGCDNLKRLIPGNSDSESTASTCQNYCFRGDCSISAEGKPKCSCKAGYSGERCEENVCYKHCLNGGVCSLNEDEQPVCQCTADYDGERCDVPTYLIKCVQAVSILKDLLNTDLSSVALGNGVNLTCAGSVV